ncbi:MAG: chemotaxis protein CheW [Bacteriovorax sp.]
MKEVHDIHAQKMSDIYGSFYIGSTELGINVRAIQEVVNFPTKITPMPLAPNFLVGVFNLRGIIVPIINLKKLLKFEENKIIGLEKVAIVEHEGVRVGLLFDKTSEIIRVHEDEKCDFSYAPTGSHNVISGAIKLDSGTRILQVIDPFSIVNIENVPRVAEHQHHKLISSQRVGHLHELRRKCISFTINQIKMAFDISGIHEIVKVSEIQQSSIQTNICLGIINLRGQVVPIINFAQLLEMPESDEKNVLNKRIIILKIEQAQFGLLVDSVESISTYVKTEIIPIPLFDSRRAGMFEGCILVEDDEILLLDHQNIFSHEEVLEITHGHSKIYKADNQKEELRNKTGKREAYISFKLDHLFGISIGDIREIINHTSDLLCAPGMPPYVLGMLNLRGDLVTIIDTRTLYSMKQEKKELTDPKILIFVSRGEKFGLVVDSVESIVHVDSEQKMKVPSLMVQQVTNRFETDIKEIVSIPAMENKESALIILSMGPVSERIRRSMAA